MSKDKKTWNENPTITLTELQLEAALTKQTLQQELIDKVEYATPDSTVRELIACLSIQDQLDGITVLEFDIDGTEDGKPIIVHVQLSLHRVGEKEGQH